MHPTDDAENIETYHPKHAKLSDVDSHFGPIGVNVQRGGAFSSDLVFGTLARFWHPMGHPSSAILNLLQEVRRTFGPHVKDCRAAFRYFVNKWHQPHLQ